MKKNQHGDLNWAVGGLRLPTVSVPPVMLLQSGKEIRLPGGQK